ncbi:MAG: glycosyl transferase, partial [Flavobacteriia bacterium]|nr:glycosyl transferase [Flavobacteriia bacterium]
MKILYAIQGTGNGHISRAIALVPEFQKLVEVDVLISGTQSQ